MSNDADADAEAERAATEALQREAKRKRRARAQGPFPQLMIDMTGDKMEVFVLDDDAPDENDKKPESAAAKKRKAERRVIGYVRVKVDQSFHEAGTLYTLSAGRIVELVEPTERERDDLENYNKAGRQHAVIRWRGRTRMLLGRDIERVSDAEWRAQTQADERTHGPATPEEDRRRGTSGHRDPDG